jgi:hypothetical protein
MKKVIICGSILLLMGGGLARGQAALLVLIFGDRVATENFYFSLKLGVTYSIIHGYEEGSNGWGFNFGLVNNIRLNDRLSLVPEFLPFAPRSIRDVPVLTTGNPNLDELLVDPSSADRKLKYIDIPVLLRVHLSDRFSVSAGPQFSILTKGQDLYKSSPIDGAILNTELDITPELSRVDVGAVIDLQCVLVKPKGGKGINIYIRYGKGFLDLVKENSGDPYTTSLLQFGATFPFVEKKE